MFVNFFFRQRFLSNYLGEILKFSTKLDSDQLYFIFNELFKKKISNYRPNIYHENEEKREREAKKNGKGLGNRRSSNTVGLRGYQKTRVCGQRGDGG